MSILRPRTGGRGAVSGDPSGLLYPEDYGASGGNVDHDDAAGMQEAFDLSATTGKAVWCHPSRTYHLSRRLDFDPSRMTLWGNAATFNWGIRTFIDPDSLPELVTNHSFDNGATGWTTGITHANPSLTFAGGAATTTATASGENGSLYTEFGQQLTMTAGTVYRVVLRLEPSNAVTALNTFTNGFNTWRSLDVSFRPNGVGNGGSGGSLKTAANTDLEYNAARTWTWDITAPYNNPYLTIGSNTGFIITSISVREYPDNKLMLIRVPSGGTLRGHVERGIDRISMVGDVNNPDWVDGMTFDTLIPSLHSRMNITGCNINQGIGRGMVFHNRAYLLNIWGTRVATSVTCFETIPGQDTGENLAIFGGNSGGGRIGVRNLGAFGLRFFSHSCDFPHQWYVGRGLCEFFTPWFETRQFTLAQSQASDFGDTQYRFDVQAGELRIIGGFSQVDGDPATNLYPEHVFRIAKNSRVTMRDHNIYNFTTTSGEWATGEGRIDCTGLRGGLFKATGPVVHASPMHNAFGTGGRFEGATVGVNAWLTSTDVTAVQANRHRIDFRARAVITCGVTRGSNVVTMTDTTGRAAGDLVSTTTDPGFPAGSTVVSVDSGTQVTVSQNYNGATGSTSVTFRAGTATGSALIEVSDEQARTGDQSLKISRTGFPNVTTIANIVWPCPPRRPIGTRFYWMVPGGGTGTVQIFFQGWFLQLENPDGEGVPRIVQSQFITDQPKTVDLELGQDWTELVFSTLRVDATTSHDGYAPEWATHVQVYLNLFNVASGFVLHIDDLHGNAM